MPKATNHAKRLRLEANLTQEELGNLADLDARTISRFETGGTVRYATAAKIAAGLSQALGIAIETDSILIYEKDETLIDNNRKPLEPSEQARGLLDELRNNRSYDFLKLITETGIPSQTISAFMDEGVPIDSFTAQKIIDYINKDTSEKVEDFRNNTLPSKSDFESIVRGALRRKGITQELFAHLIEVSPSTVNRWLNGYSFPTQGNLAAIAELLELGVNDLEDPGYRRVAETPTLKVDRATREEVKAVRLRETAASIPDQNPLLRFGVSDNAKLDLFPTLADGNDYDTIEALRSELLAARGPIEYLKERYALNPNVPQARLFEPLTKKYDEELSKDPREINYSVLYARGARFYAARRAAAQQVVSKEWPELDTEETVAIDAICDLHGPLIMASAAGRKIVEDAHQYEVPPDVFERDRETIEEFGQVIAAETEIIEPDAAEAYREITEKIEGDPQPARSRGLGIAATGSALTVIVGGAAWYAAGGAVATVVVPVAAAGAAGLVGGFFWEAIKTMPRFKRTTSKVGEQFEKALDRAERVADPKERILLGRMADLVERKRPLFERVANLRPEFEWAKKFIVRTGDDPQNQSRMSITLPDPIGSNFVQQVIEVGAPTSESAYNEKAASEYLMTGLREILSDSNVREGNLIFKKIAAQTEGRSSSSVVYYLATDEFASLQSEVSLRSGISGRSAIREAAARYLISVGSLPPVS